MSGGEEGASGSGWLGLGRWVRGGGAWRGRGRGGGRGVLEVSAGALGEGDPHEDPVAHVELLGELVKVVAGREVVVVSVLIGGGHGKVVGVGALAFLVEGRARAQVLDVALGDLGHKLLGDDVVLLVVGCFLCGEGGAGRAAERSSQVVSEDVAVGGACFGIGGGGWAEAGRAWLGLTQPGVYRAKPWRAESSDEWT